MSDDNLKAELLRQVVALLNGGQAHATLEHAVADLPYNLQGKVPDGLPYSPWQIVEHIRIAQKDILDFCRNADGSYQEKEWPKQYWPDSPAPPNESAWGTTLQQIQADGETFKALVESGELTARFPWGDGQNLLRQALLIADHNSYHIGELVVVRRLLGAWKQS